jgi:hypothetical protein
VSGVLIHDGRRAGQRLWTVDAIRAGVADGAILSAFATPRIAAPRNPNAREVADDVFAAGGEVFFDAGTHARNLPTTDKLDFYNQWELWGPSGVKLDDDVHRIEHVERVFAVQDSLGVPHLSPTLQLTSPRDSVAYDMVATAQAGSSIDRSAAQTLVGTRGFWSSGDALDAFIGELATLRAPTWVLTVANTFVESAEPDLADVEAFVGFCRSVHSLSLRSRVIVANADFSGLPAVAAGADSVGSGWDRGQRTFDPLSFHVNSDDSPRIPASYVTQGVMHAVLRRSIADAIERWDPRQAALFRGGPLPQSDAQERVHHLGQLRAAVHAIDGQPDRDHRVITLRNRYDVAESAFDAVSAAIPGLLSAKDKRVWRDNQAEVLDRYALEEGSLPTR